MNKGGKGGKYCIYLRKSRADMELEAHGEMETLARHEHSLLELARRMELPISQIYREVVSGDTISDRPMVQKLIDEVEDGYWDGVLVMEVERLARGDTIDQGVVARAFKMHDTRIITPIKTYDPSNEFDEEYFEFGLFMSRREYKTINRRLQRGRIASASEGKFIGSTAPYGYERVTVEDGKGVTLAPHPVEADAVRLIYNLYVSGDGMTVIGGKLDSLGIKPRYRDTWTKDTIKGILTNPVYIGLIRWGYREYKKARVDGKVVHRRVPNRDCVLSEGLHPPLITKQQYELAQKVKTANTHKTTRKDMTLKNPLSGLVYCLKCGSLMTRVGTGVKSPYATLRCSDKYCDNVSARIELIEGRLIQSLKEQLVKLEIDLKAQAPAVDTTKDLKYKMLKAIDKDISTIDKQIATTHDLVERGAYTVEVFLQRNEELTTKRKQLATQREDIEGEIARDTRPDIEAAIPRIKQVLAMYYDVGIKERNELLHTVVKHADYLKLVANGRGSGDVDNFELHVYPRL